MPNNEFAECMCLLENIYESMRKENPTVSILCGDFNAKSPLFWEGDTENNEGRLFNNFLISNHLGQLISEPTHVRDDGSQSCIDLILHGPTVHFYGNWCVVIFGLALQT